MSADFYEKIAPFYDLEFAEFDADVDLYLGYAGYVGSPILELGCGTGRLLPPLGRLGYNVVGIDSSPDMVARARQRVAVESLGNVEVRVGDMLTLEGLAGDQFKLVFSAINSFLHLETREQQFAALRAAHRVLHHDGLLILDVLHPIPALLQSMDDRLHVDGQWDLPSGERVDRFSHRRVHPAKQRIETTLYYDHVRSDRRVERTVASYTMRYIHRFEMESLLTEAAFDIEGVYGSYQLESLEDDSSVMIFVAHRR